MNSLLCALAPSRTPSGFWEEDKVKNVPGLGMRWSRTPHPPCTHTSSGFGDENSTPTPTSLPACVQPTGWSVSRCACGRAEWEAPRCSPHALAGETLGATPAHVLIACSRPTHKVGFPISLALHIGKLGLESKPKQQNCRGPSGVWPGFSCRSTPGSPQLTDVMRPSFQLFKKGGKTAPPRFGRPQ